MKRMVHGMLCAFALVLALWAFSALVEGPAEDDTDVQASDVPVSATLSVKAPAVPQEAQTTVQAKESTAQRYLPNREGKSVDAACVKTSDSNGYPLSGHIYARTVYTAFPPEDMPG